MRHILLEPRFVKGIPRELEAGVLYVSMEYGTVVHNCCCGCGLEVVTPLTPTDWTLTFNGEAISLWPSVGNWNLPCQSHYVIKANRVIEAGPWNKAKIKAEQRRDKASKADYYSQTAELTLALQEGTLEPIMAPALIPAPMRNGFWANFRRWLG